MKHRKEVLREKLANKLPIIAIDFDGVIHDHKNPVPGRKMGPPMEGAKEGITRLRKTHRIVIWTVWGGTLNGRQTIADWMEYYKIPFDSITNEKPSAVAYVDDKAVRFISWKELQI